MRQTPFPVAHHPPAHLLSLVEFVPCVCTALPAPGPGVNLQLSCAMTLTGWIMISLFDSLVISSLSLGLVCGIANAFNTM